MRHFIFRSLVLSVFTLGACLTPDEAEQVDDTPPELSTSETEGDDGQEHMREDFASDDGQVLEEEQAMSDDATAEAPFAAACGKAGPFLDGRVITDAVSPNSAAQQRSGSSTGCVAVGALQQTDDALYFCYTTGNDGFTWTYLENRRTRVRGWVRDHLLRSVNGVRGSNEKCGF